MDSSLARLKKVSFLLRWGLRFRSPLAMRGRRALAAAADRRQPQKQQHKKKKAAGSCCCWLLLLWWVASLRSPLAMGGGPPGFRAFGLPGFGLPGFGLLGCFCRHGGFCRRCCCHQPGQPTRAGTEDPAAAAAAINPDSRPVPERWILPPLLLEPSNPTTNHKCFTWNNPDSRPVPERRILPPLLLPSTRTADPCRNGGFFLYLTFHFSIIVNFFN